MNSIFKFYALMIISFISIQPLLSCEDEKPNVPLYPGYPFAAVQVANRSNLLASYSYGTSNGGKYIIKLLNPEEIFQNYSVEGILLDERSNLISTAAGFYKLSFALSRPRTAYANLIKMVAASTPSSKPSELLLQKIPHAVNLRLYVTVKEDSTVEMSDRPSEINPEINYGSPLISYGSQLK